MTRIILAAIAAFLMVACGGGNIPLLINSPVVSPSPLPAIHSPTPPFIPSVTLTWTIIPATPTTVETPSITASGTLTPTVTSTFTTTPITTVSQLPDLDLDILGCNTSLDILHQMGEVTNAYPVIRNITDNNLTNVCVTLSASDEARLHPDKTACVALLPAGHQIVLKLTVDTGLGQDTAIQVVASTNEGVNASVARSSCRAIGLPGSLPNLVGQIEPIP